MVNNAKPIYSWNALFTSSWKNVMPGHCVLISFGSVELSNGYSSDLWGILNANIGVKQVLWSKIYFCTDYILIAYSWLSAVNPPFTPNIHPLEEGLVSVDVGRNVFNLGYTWQYAALIRSNSSLSFMVIKRISFIFHWI